MEVEAHPDFKLRRVLGGHTEDVRAVVTAEDSSTVWIFTGSRDSTIKAWQDDGMHISEVSTLAGHADYVVALAPIPSGKSPIVPGMGLVSGSRDKSVHVWDVEEGASVQQLQGHKYQVNAVGILSSGDVISGGLDGVLNMWKGGKAVASLTEHKAAILCLCVLSSGQILTGSGDMTIKQWSGNEVDHTYEGHTDSVRALCEVPGLGFVSGSHDMTLRAWTLAGDCIATLVGHTALIYACAATSTVLASGSEDNTVRIWDLTGQCKQVISFPGCVWSLAFLPSGDFVAAVSDSKAYVFSADEIRHAPEAMIQSFSASVAEFQAAAAPEKKGAGGVPEDQIKDETALLAPGAKDNDTVFVRKDGKVMAYVWSADDMHWSMLGEVTDGPSDNVNVAKKWFDGREWDFVFDVDVAEGAPPLKLPMNKGDDPYDAAEIFLQKHQLPFTYLEQVVEFIQQNTGANDAPMAAPMDPFTGAGAYVPPAASAQPAAATGAFMDPFTGGGAYVPDDLSMSAQQPASITLPAGLSYAPHSQYQGFEAVPDPGKVAAKIRELSAAVPAPNALSEDELVAGGPIDDILMVFGRFQIATSGSGSLAPVIDTLGKLAKWPADQIFPVLDIFRLLVLNSGTARLLAADAGALQAANEGLGGMIARGLTSSVAGSRMGGKLLDLVAECADTDSKPFRVALSTTLLDLGVAVHLKDWENAEDAPMRILSLLQQVLATTPPTEEDAVFRGLLAAATTAASSKDAKQMAAGLGLIDSATTIASGSSSTKVAAVASDVKLILQ